MSKPVGSQEWYHAFRRTLRDHRWADPLQEAALAGRLGKWTQHLTGAVVETCQALGWKAAGRGHLAEMVPVRRQEYLALDVMAFAAANPSAWARPVAVFELENREASDTICYALWKLCLIRCWLGVLLCYCRNPEHVGSLVMELTRNVMQPLYQGKPMDMDILAIVGTRSRAEGFPDGFFKPYAWDPNAERFRTIL